MRLVYEVDLDVAEFGGRAQVVLPHQAVEVDRRGCAGIRLVGSDFGHGRQVRAEIVQGRCGDFDRRARWHVDYHLEL